MSNKMSLEPGFVRTPSGHRTEVRVAMSHSGSLSSPATWVPCLIQDISSNGFQIICDEKRAAGDAPATVATVGETFELKWFPYPDKVLQCRIEIRHITDKCIGTKTVGISDDNLLLCRRYIHDRVSHSCA